MKPNFRFFLLCCLACLVLFGCISTPKNKSSLKKENTSTRKILDFNDDDLLAYQEPLKL